MAIGLAWIAAAFFGFWSLYGWWFYFSSGPTHGGGAEMGVLGGVLAFSAVLVGVWLKRRELAALRAVEESGFAGAGRWELVRREEGESAIPLLKVHPNNAPGDFVVEHTCCLLCGVPWHIAPDLFAHDDHGCWVSRQPSTPREVEQMLQVLETQELGCIRYRGSDPAIRSLVVSDNLVPPPSQADQ